MTQIVWITHYLHDVGESTKQAGRGAWRFTLGARDQVEGLRFTVSRSGSGANVHPDHQPDDPSLLEWLGWSASGGRPGVRSGGPREAEPVALTPGGGAAMRRHLDSVWPDSAETFD